MTDYSSEIEPPGDGGQKPVEDTVSTSLSPLTPPAAPNQRGRDPLGRYLPKHTENVTTALNTDRLPPQLEHIHHEVEQFDAGQIADEGEAEVEIPTRRRSQLRYRSFIHRNILGVAAALEREGLKDKHGKMRLGWLSKIESLINTAIRIDSLLGLDRHAKPVNDLQTWLQNKGEHEHEPAPDSEQ